MRHQIWLSGWGRWPLFLLGWTLLSLMFVPEVYLYFLYRSEAIPWAHAVALALANAAIAFLFLPPIVWLALPSASVVEPEGLSVRRPTGPA